MSVDKVRKYLEQFGAADRIHEFEESSATVELAAKALGTAPERIAKSISLYSNDGGCILIVCAGDVKIDNKKFKECFGCKPKMLSADDVLPMTGHPVGGVCPFDVNNGVKVYLDESLRRFDTVYPAAGSASSAVELTCDELFRFSGALSWEDVCKSCTVAPV